MGFFLYKQLCNYTKTIIHLKACSNGPNNVGPTLCNKRETLGSTACFPNVFDNPIRFIPVETLCIKAFAKEAAQNTI